METQFGLVIGFINNLQVVTTITYYTVTYLQNLHSLHANLFSLSVTVFSLQSHWITLQIKPSIRTIRLHWLTSQLSLTITHAKSSIHTSDFELTANSSPQTLTKTANRFAYIVEEQRTEKKAYPTVA
jgi:hypothetical protein